MINIREDLRARIKAAGGDADFTLQSKALPSGNEIGVIQTCTTFVIVIGPF